LKVEFTISGECESKERPRFNKRSGTVRTADKTRNFEEVVRLSYGRRHYFDDKPIVLTVNIFSKRPKKPKHNIPTKKDLDNMLKAVQDGLNGVAYKDDRYISDIHTSKRFSDNARIEVIIEDL
jgi:Holliday junction resolvase RusA-like endonuclease